MSNTQMMEFLYASEYLPYVYIDYFVKNQLTTKRPEELIIPTEGVLVNKNRTFLIDNALIVDYLESTDEWPLEKKLKFVNNEKFELGLRKSGTIKIGSDKPYEITGIVNRINIWIFYPLTTIYLLICPEPYKIYVMQTCSTDRIKFDDLPFLGSQLNLPIGWLYTSMTLDEKTFFCVSANNDAELIKDDISNSYQYVKETDASWLYDKYR